MYFDLLLQPESTASENETVLLRGPGHQYDSPISYQEDAGGALTTVQESAPEVEENVETVDEEVRL